MPPHAQTVRAFHPEQLIPDPQDSRQSQCSAMERQGSTGAGLQLASGRDGWRLRGRGLPAHPHAGSSCRLDCPSEMDLGLA